MSPELLRTLLSGQHVSLLKIKIPGMSQVQRKLSVPPKAKALTFSEGLLCAMPSTAY